MKKKCEKADNKEGLSCYFSQHKKEFNYYLAIRDEIAKRELVDEN
jgi:hypothetical protein